MKILMIPLLFLVATFANGDELPDPEYTYHGVITSIYDGDTMTADIDLGFDVHYHARLRIALIDAPELRGDEKEEGIKVRDHVRLLLLNKKVVIHSKSKGKYGRWLASILFINEGQVTDLGSYLLSTGRAELYE